MISDQNLQVNGVLRELLVARICHCTWREERRSSTYRLNGHNTFEHIEQHKESGRGFQQADPTHPISTYAK